MSLTPNYNYTVAVVIPNWNGEKYLPEMLDSILEQSFKDYRVFVVDDQSTDNSIELLKAYSAKDSRIKYYVRDREPKGGQTCRNTGFALSEGAKYVVFFDNDDLVAPYCLEQRVHYMEEHSDLDFAIFPAMNFEKVPYDNPNTVWGCRYIDDTFKAMLNWTLPMVGWTNIYRRSSYKSKGLQWDERLKSLQDSDFNIQAIIKKCKFEYADEAAPDYFYRYSIGSVSTKLYSKEHAGSHVLLVKKIIESLNEELLEKYDKDIKSYYLKFTEIIFQHAEHLKELMDLEWLREQKLFRYKLKLWLVFGHKYRILHMLFSKEFKYFSHQQSNWSNFVNNKSKQFLNKPI